MSEYTTDYFPERDISDTQSEGPPTMPNVAADGSLETPSLDSSLQRLTINKLRLESLMGTALENSAPNLEGIALKAKNLVRRMEGLLASYDFVTNEEKKRALDELAGQLSDRAGDLAYEYDGGIKELPNIVPEKIRAQYVDNADEPTGLLLRLPIEKFIHKHDEDKYPPESRIVFKGGYLVDEELTRVEVLRVEDAVLVLGPLRRLMQQYKELVASGAEATMDQATGYIEKLASCEHFFNTHYGADGLNEEVSDDKLDMNAFHLELTESIQKAEHFLVTKDDVKDEATGSAGGSEEVLPGTRQLTDEELEELQRRLGQEVKDGQEPPSGTDFLRRFGQYVAGLAREAAYRVNGWAQESLTGEAELGADSPGNSGEMFNEQNEAIETELNSKYSQLLEDAVQVRDEILASVGGNRSALGKLQLMRLEDLEDDIAFYREQLGIEAQSEELQAESGSEAPREEPPLDEFTARRRERLLKDIDELRRLRDAMLAGDHDADTGNYDNGIHEMLGELRRIDEQAEAA